MMHAHGPREPGGRQTERGSTLVFVLAIAIIAFGVVTTLLMSSQMASRTERERSEASKAWWSAMSGLKLAMRELNNVPTGQSAVVTASFDGSVGGQTAAAASPGTPTDMRTRPDGSFAVRTIQQGQDLNGAHYVIEAFGKFGNTVTVLRGVAGPGKYKPFGVGMFSDGLTQVAGAGVVDAYDSTLGPYDPANVIPGVEVLAANGNILLSSTQASFDGDDQADDHAEDDHAEDDHADDDHAEDDHGDDDGDDHGDDETEPPAPAPATRALKLAIYAPNQDCDVYFVGTDAEAPVDNPPAADDHADDHADEDHGNDDNRSGLGDDTNPGQGDGRDNSPNEGTDNPNKSGHDDGGGSSYVPAAPTGARLASARAGSGSVRFDGNDDNRSGLGDDTNPGEGGGQANSPNEGTDNPSGNDHDDDHAADDHAADDHGDDDHGDDTGGGSSGLWVKGLATSGPGMSVLREGKVTLDGPAGQLPSEVHLPPVEQNEQGDSALDRVVGAGETFYLSGERLVNNLRIDKSGRVVVNADALLIVLNDFTLAEGGTLEIAADAKLQMALYGGATILGEVLNSGRPENFVISSAASTDESGKKFVIKTRSFQGAIVAGNLHMTTEDGGEIGFHFDKSLETVSALTCKVLNLWGFIRETYRGN